MPDEKQKPTPTEPEFYYDSLAKAIVHVVPSTDLLFIRHGHGNRIEPILKADVAARLIAVVTDKTISAKIKHGQYKNIRVATLSDGSTLEFDLSGRPTLVPTINTPAPARHSQPVNEPKY